MKIGVISDTHIPDRAKDIPRKIMEEFKNVDMIIHSGDLVDLSVVETLRSVCKDVRAVWGNMDPDNIKRSLPEKLIITVGSYRIGVMHGFGAANKLTELLKETFKKDNVNIIVFGHSHSPMNDQIDNVLYFNPGSATDKIFAAYNSYGIIELGDKIKARIVKI